jgi:hypothetical protein
LFELIPPRLIEERRLVNRAIAHHKKHTILCRVVKGMRTFRLFGDLVHLHQLEITVVHFPLRKLKVRIIGIALGCNHSCAPIEVGGSARSTAPASLGTLPIEEFHQA